MRNFIWIVLGILLHLPLQAEELSPASDNSKPKWEFLLESGIVSRQIQAQDRVTDGKGEFNSTALPQAKLGVGYTFSDIFKMSLLASIQQNEFQDVSENQSTQRPSATSEIEMRLRRPMAELAEVHLGAGTQKRLFSRALSFNEFTFDEANVAFWGLGVEGAFPLEDNMFVGGMVDFRSLGASEAHGYTVEEGSELKAAIFAKKRLRSFGYFGKLFYNYSDQNSLLVKQTEKQTGISLGVTYVY